MSNTTRLHRDSSDEDRNPYSYLQSSDSDSEDLEVVEPVGTPQSATTYEPTNSPGEELPCHISGIGQNFYHQYDASKDDQDELTYSLDDPSNGNNFQDDYEPSYENNTSSKKSSKKKKEKSSRHDSSSPVPSSKKSSSKRKHHSEDGNSRHSKRFHSEMSNPYQSQPREPYSDDFDTHPMSYYDPGQTSQGYSPKYTSPTKSPSSQLPDLAGDDYEMPSFAHYGRKEEKHKSHKKLDRHSNSEKADLKKRIDSSNKGNLLMQKMGYREGEGLGKNAQGRVDPVELSKQKGRRGLGMSLPGIDDNQVEEWDPTLEEITVHEAIDWLENHEYDILDCDKMMENWLLRGHKNLDIGSMTEFIDEELLNGILQKKSIFDNLSDDELQRTIVRSNPFETIRKCMFMNRAAVKMANMDSAFDFMFTEPKCRKKVVKQGPDEEPKVIMEPMVKEDELLYFADVCAGPGGFSEYVLWRKKWRAKGIGFTLKGDCDFKIQDFNAGSSETFEPYYGKYDDGNIYNPENITSLEEFVMRVTENKGVHFMMADGGFSVKGQENIQELLSKQLYLCQFLVALTIVREEGHFVCKLFDLFSPFSAGLIYLIYRAFDQICIFKPNTSRPANSERYIICKHRKRNVEEIRSYLFNVNEILWKLGSASNEDILEIVPVPIIKDNREFYEYLRDSNNKLGNKQLISLTKVIAYFKDPNLHEPQQNAMRKQCLEVWNIPTSARRIDKSTDMETTKSIMKGVFKDKFKQELIADTLNIKGNKLLSKNLREIFDFSIFDWECVPLGSDKLVFLLGLGKNRVYQWVGSRWDHEDDIELPPGTLVYGEFVPEFRGKGMSQKKMTAFHIIDGLSVGNEIISHYDYEKRIKILNLFTSAIKKYNNNSLCPIKVKSPRPMMSINKIFSSVIQVLMKSGSYEICQETSDHMESLYLQMKGICFIRTTKEPWRKHLSKKTNHYYYYNSATRASFYEDQRPGESFATTIDSLKNQVLWMWEAGVGFKGEDRVSNVLHKEDLLEFIFRKRQQIS